LDRILTFLPIKEAARTSVLSSNWRYQWRSIPHLVFDADFATLSDDYTCNPDEGNKRYQFVVPPGSTVGFSKLTLLELKEVDIPDNYDFFGTFLPHCPLLEQLRVFDCTSTIEPLFESASLKALFFHSCFKTICFKDTSRLSVLSVVDTGKYCYCDDDFIDGVYDPDMVALFAALPALKQLKLGIELLLFLSNGHVPYKLPAASLTNLEVLEIPRLLLDSLPEARVLLCLIMSSPNLRRLTIVHDDDDEDHPEFEHIDSLQMLLELKDDHHPGGVCCLQRLEEFSIHIGHGDQVELDLARFVLATAPLLKTVFVKPTEGLPSEDAITFLVEMTQYKRISKEAEVKYMQLMSIDED
ncbi:F-box/FBD/LRR-repeat protein At1g13570, partial [Linum perenne]